MITKRFFEYYLNQVFKESPNKEIWKDLVGNDTDILLSQFKNNVGTFLAEIYPDLFNDKYQKFIDNYQHEIMGYSSPQIDKRLVKNLNAAKNKYLFIDFENRIPNGYFEINVEKILNDLFYGKRAISIIAKENGVSNDIINKILARLKK